MRLRCMKCHREMVGTTAYDGACACGGLVERAPDLVVGGGGTIYTLAPETDEARAWIKQNVACESWQWLGAALCVEHRYIEVLVTAAENDGLVVEVA